MSTTERRFRPPDTDEVGPAGEIDERARPLFVLTEVLENRYSDLAFHGRAVAGYCAVTARELRLESSAIERVTLAGELHDVGKVAVDESILRKPGRLEPEEWRQVQRHPQVGADLLFSSNLDDLAGWVLCHHERPDGSGYPHRLAADEIPLESRILAVADAYDAMRTHRVYQPALDHHDAAGELISGAGKQFDRDVANAFLVALGRLAAGRAPGENGSRTAAHD